MKIIFKNITKYNKENCNNFIGFHANKYGKKEVMRYILGFVCFLYIFICNIIYKNWYILLILILVGGLLYFIHKQQAVKNQKEKKRIKEYTFCFYEMYIKVKYRKEFNRIPYFKIKKIFETDNNFFLYTDDTHSLILDKEGFVIGNPKEFSEFIKKKCPFKYRSEMRKTGRKEN